MPSSVRHILRTLSIVSSALCVALALAPSAGADQTITSAGPLTQIGVGSNLSCSVNYSGDSFGEFFGNTACGTYLSVGGPVADGGTVYGAPGLPAAGAVASTAFIEDGQTPVDGDGTAAHPFTVSTQVDAGTTGLSVTQTDSYVTGADEYKTTVLITNSGSTAQTVNLYHAADCYLGNEDVGYGYRDSATGGIFCTKNADNTPPGRVEGFIPVEGGSHYLETYYGSNWAAIGTGEPLPDSCDCSTFEDNSMSIDWTVTVPAGDGVTRSWATDFSPVGNIQASSYVALGDSVAAGEGINEDWSWAGNVWTQGDPYPWDTSSGRSDTACHQSLDGYPHVLEGLLNTQLLDLACTGAGTVDGILGSQSGKGGGPQLGSGGTANSAYDAAEPDVVTLTVGADDIDFATKVEDCYTPLMHACGSSGDRATLSSQLSTLRSNLTDVLDEIKDRGIADGKIPVVAVTEYYSPFPNSYPTNSSCIDISPNRRLGVTLTNGEMQYLKEGLLELNGTIDDVASQFPNVVIVPAPVSFAQHRWCSSEPWVYGPSLDTSVAGHLKAQAPFHPTPAGQKAIGLNIAQYLHDERHVVPGAEVPLDFGDIALLLHEVQTAGTAFFTALGSSAPSAAQAPAAAHSLQTALQASSQTDAATGLPPTNMFSPVQIYFVGTSAQYVNGLTITLPSLGASALYEVVDGAWQLIPSTSDGTNLTATLDTLGPLALGNPVPAIHAKFALSGDNGQAPASVSFDAGGSTVESGSIASYEWNFGDGTTGTGIDTGHVYAASGTYDVTLTTTSDAGAGDTVEHEVKVLNSPPVAVSVSPGTATAGVPVSGFDAAASHDANGPITSTYWDFGDGSPVVDEVSPTHTFSTPGTYTVTTTVFDDEGADDSTTASITVGAKTSTESPDETGSGSLPPGNSGQAPPGTAGPAPVTTPKTRPRQLRCHRGFRKKRIHRKDKCVRLKKHHRQSRPH